MMKGKLLFTKKVSCLIMYGPTIKIIRNNKDLSLRAVYNDICSKTNAIKFEKGQRTLAADRFNMVLSNLMINMSEFLWIHNDYKPLDKNYIRYQVAKFWNEDKDKEFSRYIGNIQDDYYKPSIDRIQLASYRLLNDYQNDLKPNRFELNILINYFSSIDSWTISDLKFFTNNCYILPYDLMIILLQEALKVQKRYQYFENSDMIFAALISNCVDRMISNQDIKHAKNFISILFNISKGIIMNGYRLLGKYYEAKLNYLYLANDKGKKQLDEVLKTSKFLNNEKLIKEINTPLE